MVQIGDYIIYPAFFILLFALFILLLVFIALKNIISERKKEKSFFKFYKITSWQKKHLIELMSAYLREYDIYDKYSDKIEKLQSYISESTYWNVDELLEIDGGLVWFTSSVLFEIAKLEYLDDNIDNAVLALNTFDFVNGGMDNEEIEPGEPYEWIGSDVDELRNSGDMTDEEARTLYLYDSAVIDLYTIADEDIGKIPEDVEVEEFCKRISMIDMESALEDIETVVDIMGLKDETRDIIAKALFNKCSLLMGEIGAEAGNVKTMDEYRRYTIRALAAIIDNSLYSDVMDSIEFDDGSKRN